MKVALSKEGSAQVADVGISWLRSVEEWQYPACQPTMGALDPMPIPRPSILKSMHHSSLRVIIAVAPLAAKHLYK